MKNNMKIISCDGGGVRGLYTAAMLHEILGTLYKGEKVIDFSKYFDVFIGVSTGSIISTLLFFGFKTHEIYNFYFENINTIFSKYSAIKYYKKRYDISILRKIILNFLEINKDRIKNIDENKELILISYDIMKDEVLEFIFNKQKLQTNTDLEKLALCICASCAAPMYFNEIEIEDRICVDGGVVTKNPALLAYSRLASKGYETKKIKILSIGTIQSSYKTITKVDDSWLPVYDIKSNIDMFTESGIDYTNKVLERIYIKEPKNYLRIDEKLNFKIELDNINNNFKKTINDLEKNYKEKFEKKVIDFFNE